MSVSLPPSPNSWSLLPLTQDNVVAIPTLGHIVPFAPDDQIVARRVVERRAGVKLGVLARARLVVAVSADDDRADPGDVEIHSLEVHRLVADALIEVEHLVARGRHRARSR